MTGLPERFLGWMIREGTEGRVEARFEEVPFAALDPGEVVIRVAYSSVNYKDALAATGKGKIIRRFPCVGGIDLAGWVLTSEDPRFREGDAVVATGFDLGVSHHGGFAEVARVPSAWVVPLPKGLTLWEAMALGTAGFTAALAVERLEREGVSPEAGTVVVTGASGGVGTLAIQMLARRGYRVAALTGKPEETGSLRRWGAAEVLDRRTIDFAAVRPLEKGRWAGAIDNVGGAVLHWLLASMQRGGAVASVGNAGSAEVKTTIFPFILRGVSMLGVDSAYTGFPLRSRVWERLGDDLKPPFLSEVTREVALKELPSVFEALIAGKGRGRTVVRIDTA
ncbi:MAG: oxidoreductase [Hydrogenophilus sp.]|nr:oxidoreductase [Hydrogenophilus sp.]